MQSTLKVSKKTHPRVLPQLRALKVPLDAPAKVKAGTGETGSLLANQADFQHGRGERPAPSDGAGPSPSPQGEEKSGVTRVFVRASDGRSLMLCQPVKAHQLLRSGRARTHKLYPC
jgi:hypothetical protein